MSIGAPLRTAALLDKRYFRWITPVTISLALIAATTLLLWQIDVRLSQEHLIFIYFVPTTLVALRYGSISAMGVIIASCLAAAYFLYPPKFSFMVASRLDLLELALFCMLALLASQVVSGIAKTDLDKRRRSEQPLQARSKWAAVNELFARVRSVF